MNAPTLKDEYARLERDRYKVLERAHKNAVLTVPSIQPRDYQSSEDLPQNFQSMGARGVANLSSKLLLSLFPPTMAFMRLELDPATLEELIAEDARLAEAGEKPKIVSEVQAALSEIEKQALSEFDTEGWRPVVAEALRLLVVTGNCVIYDRPGAKSPTVLDLRQFVAKRDPENRLKTLIIRQGISVIDAEAYLGHELTRAQLQGEGFPEYGTETNEDVIDLYTGARRTKEGKFEFFQEIAGEIVSGSQNLVEPKDLPLMHLQFSPVFGESYGRSYIEDYQADLLVLEQLSRALAEGAMIMSKVVFLVRPGSSTKVSSISSAPNGSVRVGDSDDISAIQAQKGGDMAVAYSQMQDLKTALAKAFLLNSSVQRGGERVTAEEVRFSAMELEAALGGVYSSLAETVQRPLVEYLYSRMKRTGKITALPKEVKPVIATGLEAISRNHQAVRIQQFLQSINQSIPPDQLIQYLRYESLLADLATSLNLPKDQYIRTAEEIQQIMAAQQQQSAVENLGPDVIRAAAQQ